MAQRKRFYKSLERSGLSFEEQIGPPSEVQAAVGRIAMNFAELEAVTVRAIGAVLGVSGHRLHILTSELAFKVKMHVLASLTRDMIAASRFPAVSDDPEAQLSDLVRLCFEAEERRNQILHSHWDGTAHGDHEARRKKISAKASRGLQILEETMTSAELLDIADFIIYAAIMVEEFYDLEFGDPDNAYERHDGPPDAV